MSVLSALRKHRRFGGPKAKSIVKRNACGRPMRSLGLLAMVFRFGSANQATAIKAASCAPKAKPVSKYK